MISVLADHTSVPYVVCLWDNLGGPFFVGIGPMFSLRYYHICDHPKVNTLITENFMRNH